jgi:hypothetical protein
VARCPDVCDRSIRQVMLLGWCGLLEPRRHAHTYNLHENSRQNSIEKCRSRALSLGATRSPRTSSVHSLASDVCVPVVARGRASPDTDYLLHHYSQSTVTARHVALCETRVRVCAARAVRHAPPQVQGQAGQAVITTSARMATSPTWPVSRVYFVFVFVSARRRRKHNRAEARRRLTRRPVWAGSGLSRLGTPGDTPSRATFRAQHNTHHNTCTGGSETRRARTCRRRAVWAARSQQGRFRGAVSREEESLAPCRRRDR